MVTSLNDIVSFLCAVHMSEMETCGAGDAGLPTIISILLTSTSIFIGVIVIILGSRSAYERALAKMQQKQHNATNSSIDSRIPVTSFLKYLPIEIYRKKSCYFPIATHIIDQATDIGTIAHFYYIYQRERDGYIDCSGISPFSLFILSVLAFTFYRIVSSIWVYTITCGGIKNKRFHAILQLFDLKIFHAIYINFSRNKEKPNIAQKYLQLMEACLESFPQIIIQFYYFIKLDFTFKGNYVLLISLIFSIYSVSTRITREDKNCFCKSWREANAKCCSVNKYFVIRCLVRLMDVTCRVTFILAVWIYFGGIFAALYIAIPFVVLAVHAKLIPKYVCRILSSTRVTKTSSIFV